MATFVPPVIQDNPDGWGPCAVPENFLDMPYQPFEKSQRLGKISDWTGNTYQDKRYQNKYNSAFGAGSQYAYYHEEDESTFQLVDTTKTQRPLYQRGRVKFNQQRQQRERRAQINAAKLEILSKSQKSRERDRQRQLRKWQKSYGRQVQENKKLPTKHRDASVQVRDSWTVLEEMDFVRLSKLSLPNIGDGSDLYTCGTMEYYDKKYDRVNTKSEKKMKRVNRIFHTVTTTDDPIIRQLAKSKGNVFATDTILTTLMCCTRSVYPWDIVVQRVGNKLFFDKRDDSEFDLLTVSETAVEPPVDDGGALNSPKNLALEATFINHNFTQQVLKSDDEKYSFPNSNPFLQKGEEAEMASVGYRYRRFDIGNDIQLVVRCEHDAVTVGTNGETQFINIKALNEWDSRFCGGVDWRTKLDIQRGAVLATELKNNSFKMAKWTASALLAGSDQIKFGFVSRTHYRDSTRHTVLGMQQFKPSEFALQMNLNLDNAWGILRCLIDFCMKLKEGKYLIMKDPMKPVIRIYDIPDNTFEDEDEDDSEEDQAENSEEDNEDDGDN